MQDSIRATFINASNLCLLPNEMLIESSQFVRPNQAAENEVWGYWIDVHYADWYGMQINRQVN